MIGEWRKNKSLDFINSGIHAEFSTLYEDQRDIMSDCVRPIMGISDRDDNRRVEILDGSKVLFCREVGNQMYRDILEISKMWNPYKQREAVKQWSRSERWYDEDKRAWVIEGQKH